MDAIISSVYDNIKLALGDKKITPDEIIPIATQCMVMVQVYKTLSGEEKKLVVLTVLKMLVEKSNMNTTDKASLTFVIDAVVPAAIDAIKDAFKHKINLASVKSWWDSCCGGTDATKKHLII
jgi:citrate lyase gamma subunit